MASSDRRSKNKPKYVYNIPIPANLAPESVKKVITHGWPSGLMRSKTYRESTNEVTKKDVDVVVSSRKSVSSIKEARGSRSSVSQVESLANVGAASELLHAKVLVSDMPGFMQLHAFRCARTTYDSMETFSSKQVAYNMKKEFDKVYGPAWHCIVGSSFGSFVTHSTGCFLYFSMEKLYVLVFKTKPQKPLRYS